MHGRTCVYYTHAKRWRIGDQGSKSGAQNVSPWRGGGAHGLHSSVFDAVLLVPHVRGGSVRPWTGFAAIVQAIFRRSGLILRSHSRAQKSEVGHFHCFKISQFLVNWFAFAFAWSQAFFEEEGSNGSDDGEDQGAWHHKRSKRSSAGSGREAATDNQSRSKRTRKSFSKQTLPQVPCLLSRPLLACFLVAIISQFTCSPSPDLCFPRRLRRSSPRQPPPAVRSSYSVVYTRRKGADMQGEVLEEVPSLALLPCLHGHPSARTCIAEVPSLACLHGHSHPHCRGPYNSRMHVNRTCIVLTCPLFEHAQTHFGDFGIPAAIPGRPGTPASLSMRKRTSGFSAIPDF